MIIENFDNVIYDENSDYQFTELNETTFLIQFFHRLKEEMAENFHKYVFIVFSSHSTTKFPVSVKKDFGVPKVLIFISEETGAYPGQLTNDFYAIFKSYLKKNAASGQPVFPFPLGYTRAVKELPVIPVQQRENNVFFSGNLNNNRVPLFRQLSVFKYLLPEKLIGLLIRFKFIKKIITRAVFLRPVKNSIIKFNTGFQKGLSPQEYAFVIANSKIVFCPKGFSSPESFRHFEAMRAGCVIISEKLPDHEFYAHSPIIQIKNWKTGVNIARSLLSDEKKLEDLHLQTLAWWKNKCSEPAIAAYVHQCMKSIK